MKIDSYLSERQKRRRKRHRYLLGSAALIATYLILIGTAWFFISSPIFRVSKVEVTGNLMASSDSVIALLQSAALRDHNFGKSVLGFGNMLTWPGKLGTDDLVFTPEIASLSVEKDYFSHIITANVVERQPFAVWCKTTDNIGNETCYSFDHTGFIFRKTPDTQGNLIAVVHDHSVNDPAIGGYVLPAVFLPNLISVVNVINGSGIVPQEIVVNDLSLQQVDVKTQEGPVLHFSLRFPAVNYLPILQNLVTQPNFRKLQYVDFTVLNRAYYR